MTRCAYVLFSADCCVLREADNVMQVLQRNVDTILEHAGGFGWRASLQQPACVSRFVLLQYHAGSPHHHTEIQFRDLQDVGTILAWPRRCVHDEKRIEQLAHAHRRIVMFAAEQAHRRRSPTRCTASSGDTAATPFDR
jgi:hypothetical protein